MLPELCSLATVSSSVGSTTFMYHMQVSGRGSGQMVGVNKAGRGSHRVFHLVKVCKRPGFWLNVTGLNMLGLNQNNDLP